MRRKISLIGQVFGDLTVIREAKTRETKSGQMKAYWLCSCFCGNDVEVVSQSLRCGATKSCGCLRGKNSKTHGMSNTSEYNSWRAMKERCDNPNNKRYELYGGRGIEYDKDWISFENFYADMGVRPDGKTLDRINSDGDYCKGNCRWSDPITQAYNTSLNSQTERNTSGKVGVTLLSNGKYKSFIGFGGQKYLGCFDRFEDAVEVRLNKEVEFFGKVKV